MHSSIVKRVRIATILFLVSLLFSVLADTAQATGYQGGINYQVGDFIICFGSTGGVGGTCNVLRNTTSGLKLLDQFSDGLLGDTRGVAIDNTLHPVVASNGGASGSNVVVYTIASEDPTQLPPTPIAHFPVSTPFTASGVTNSSNAQTVVVNKFGHIFVGNAGSGGGAAPSVVELNPDGTLANPSLMPSNPLILPSNCTDTKGHLLSMDLSKDGLSLYLTSNVGSYSTSTSNGGSIQKLTLSAGTCAPFASFGPGVALNGIQVVPPGALTAVNASCNGTIPCPPTNETILVVAEGFFDSDGDPGAGEPGPGIPDQTDDVNVCTNQLNSSLVSCALLLDTGGPGLTKPAWVAFNPYSPGDRILDANLHVQEVTSSNGTSGASTPSWQTNGSTTPDGNLIWTDRGTSVIARYSVAVNTLQALSLDQLVTDCTGGNCSLSPPPPTVSNFWLGDSQSPNFYEFNFGNGNLTSFNTSGNDANANRSTVCSTCSVVTAIQGFRIYGAEGANQANLTKLASGSLSASNNFTGFAQFPLPVDSTNTNSLTVTLAGTTPASTPFALYGSLISQAAPSPNGNNSGASDVGSVGVGGFTLTPPPPCQPTTSDVTKCIVWKVDVSELGLPSGTFIDTNFQARSCETPPATCPITIDNNTHVFLDEHYDVTSFVGRFDPGGVYRPPSVWSLQEVIPAAFSSGSSTSQCFYLSPSPANACFKTNRGTLPFIFQCPGLSNSDFVALQNPPGPPLISIVQSSTLSSPKPAPQPIKLTATNNKAPYRYDPTKNYYIFNWTTKSFPASKLDACTFDPTGKVQSFCIPFRMDPTCK